MTTRMARVELHGSITPEVVAAYLPQNYKIISVTWGKDDDDTRKIGHCIISGTDNHGWTLDGYVIPRLGSGLIAAKEIDNGLADIDAYEKRVRELEAEGCSRSDAQAVADAELEQRS